MDAWFWKLRHWWMSRGRPSRSPACHRLPLQTSLFVPRSSDWSQSSAVISWTRQWTSERRVFFFWVCTHREFGVTSKKKKGGRWKRKKGERNCILWVVGGLISSCHSGLLSLCSWRYLLYFLFIFQRCVLMLFAGMFLPLIWFCNFSMSWLTLFFMSMFACPNKYSCFGSPCPVISSFHPSWKVHFYCLRVM